MTIRSALAIAKEIRDGKWELVENRYLCRNGISINVIARPYMLAVQPEFVAMPVLDSMVIWYFGRVSKLIAKPKAKDWTEVIGWRAE